MKILNYKELEVMPDGRVTWDGHEGIRKNSWPDGEIRLERNEVGLGTTKTYFFLPKGWGKCGWDSTATPTPYPCVF